VIQPTTLPSNRGPYPTVRPHALSDASVVGRKETLPQPNRNDLVSVALMSYINLTIP